ncbi:MAG TPA: FAD:protein FMN transferase [Gemmatimonadales bacterium]|nr:FAD:protein FMN transferase [Gemmatimonadales bacterium]
MMSVAAWAADTARLASALTAAHDSVERIDSLVQGTAFGPLDSLRRELRQHTGMRATPESLASGYALDRAALALAGIADSALFDLGGQYLWIGPAGGVTHRIVGIPDPDNSLDALGWVDLRGGSIRTQSRSAERPGRARSVTVLAGDALSAHAWSIAFFAIGCDSAFAVAARLRGRIGVVCADSARVRWTPDLEKRVTVPESSRPAPAP